MGDPGDGGPQERHHEGRADFEKIQKQGDQAIKNWIDAQLKGTTVTAVLVGAETCVSRWVKYEIEQSIKRRNGLLGIDISKIKDFNGKTSERCGKIPVGYDFYLWNNDDGYNKLGDWVEPPRPLATRLKKRS